MTPGKLVIKPNGKRAVDSTGRQIVVSPTGNCACCGGTGQALTCQQSLDQYRHPAIVVSGAVLQADCACSSFAGVTLSLAGGSVNGTYALTSYLTAGFAPTDPAHFGGYWWAPSIGTARVRTYLNANCTGGVTSDVTYQIYPRLNCSASGLTMFFSGYDPNSGGVILLWSALKSPPILYGPPLVVTWDGTSACFEQGAGTVTWA